MAAFPSTLEPRSPRSALLTQRSFEWAIWLLAAMGSACAAEVTVFRSTPIDRALPLLAVVITFVAFTARRPGSSPTAIVAIQLGVPLLLVCEILFPDEWTRLLAFGLVLGLTLCAALLATRSGMTQLQACGFAAAGVMLLRWIPLGNVLIFRELFVLAGAVAIVMAFRKPSALAVALAMAVALFTPAIPTRSLALPFLVALVTLLLGPSLRLEIVSLFSTMLMLLVFAWSGIAARALPLFAHPELFAAANTDSVHGDDPDVPLPRYAVRAALAPGESFSVDIPDHSRNVIVSGANVAGMRAGAVLGVLEPGHIIIRIGDASDWGFLRREHFIRSRNMLPASPAGRLRDYGIAAWVDAAGRVALRPSTHSIRVTADRRLPRDARLQIESIEWSNR